MLLGQVADELPDPVDYSLVLDLLDFAMAPLLTGGPAIGRDPESGILQAFAVIPAEDLSADEFIKAVQSFIEFQVALSERIAGSGETESDESDPLGALNKA